MEVCQLQLISIYLKNFRCFDQITIDLDSRVTLICGANGAGKTSLLEALYYGCYLRSFKTHLSHDIIALGKESFFVKLLMRGSSKNHTIDHTIQVGFSNNKRLVKIDNKTATSYKDLLSYYRVVSLTEDDLNLIQNGPIERRSFLDQAILLHDASFITILREYRVVLENRNALLQQNDIDKEAYLIWTRKLWEHTSRIQIIRKQFLISLNEIVNVMLKRYVDENLFVSFTYQAKKNSDKDFDTFWNKNTDLMRLESCFKRSFFGIHLDDFIISLEGKKSRAYASRGQQKMIILLIKIAQLKLLMPKSGPGIFLLDDFMTDFDVERGRSLLSALFELDCQLIFTSPRRDSLLEKALISSMVDYKVISI